MQTQTQIGSVTMKLLPMLVLVAVITIGLHVACATAKLPPVEATTVLPSPTNPCATNVSGKLLLVSIAEQHLWACDATVLAKDSAVTTGTTVVTNGVNDSTPTGTWKIYSKQTNQNLIGTDANGRWDDPVAYWMPFDGEVGFHDASWQTFPFGSSQYHTDGSHGCVHLPTSFIAWLYSWAPIGTTVTVKA
jgi:hypothetical protein